jgi:drug/metabolite transporter (DMT)-like permease
MQKMSSNKKDSMNKGNSQIRLIILFAIALVGQSFASVFVKLTGTQAVFSAGFFKYFFCTLVVLGIYALMWQVLLERVTLTGAYMFKGVTYILILVWSVLIFQETITVQNIIGSALIVVGVAINARDI